MKPLREIPIFDGLFATLYTVDKLVVVIDCLLNSQIVRELSNKHVFEAAQIG